ncbi:MAG: hypothetical protein GXP10_10640, partial [Gammaproteobacteria bacterium]|nr:hypothetical protein [Gammaproteobacteria bacterium]
YAWIGYYLLKDHKKNRMARKFLVASLRLRPWQKRTFLLLLLSLFSLRIAQSLRLYYATAKTAIKKYLLGKR